MQTGKGYETLFRTISLYVYQFPLRYKYCTEEDCAEFYLSFYSRIPNIIDHYREQGKGIEAYIRTCLKWHIKTYLKSKLKENRIQQFAFTEWKLNAPTWVESETLREEGGAFGMELRESSPPLLKATEWQDNGKSYLIKNNTIRKNKSSKKQEKVKPRISGKQAKKLLLLCLKAAYDLEDRTIQSIAQSIGLHHEVLFHLIEATRSTLLEKEERFRMLQEKRNKLYFRICFLEEDMNRCTSVLEKESLIQRLARLKYHFQKLHRKLSHHYLAPSHQKVAEILGIPKGSIDSTLYYLKKGY